MQAGDSELVRRARSGDREAYGMLIARHQEVAFRVAYAACGDAAEAQDAVQEAFIKAHRALWRFRANAPFRPWLLRIAANEARNRRRSAGRREHLAVMAAGGAAPAGSEAPAFSTGELAAALDRLDPAHREVVLLRHVLELSEAETAAALGCRPGTVKSRLSRALARMREELDGA